MILEWQRKTVRDVQVVIITEATRGQNVAAFGSGFLRQPTPTPQSCSSMLDINAFYPVNPDDTHDLCHDLDSVSEDSCLEHRRGNVVLIQHIKDSGQAMVLIVTSKKSVGCWRGFIRSTI